MFLPISYAKVLSSQATKSNQQTAPWAAQLRWQLVSFSTTQRCSPANVSRTTSSWSTINFHWFVELWCHQGRFVNSLNCGPRNLWPWPVTDSDTHRLKAWWDTFWASTTRLAAQWLLQPRAAQNTHPWFNKQLSVLIWKKFQSPQRRSADVPIRAKIKLPPRRRPTLELSNLRMAKRTQTPTTWWLQPALQCLATSSLKSSRPPRRRPHSQTLWRGQQSVSIRTSIKFASQLPKKTWHHLTKLMMRDLNQLKNVPSQARRPMS